MLRSELPSWRFVPYESIVAFIAVSNGLFAGPANAGNALRL
jgi:hypothetical protein